jgi:hypothetical protein
MSTTTQHTEVISALADTVVNTTLSGYEDRTVAQIVADMAACEITIEIAHGHERDGWATRHQLWLDADDEAAIIALATERLA